MQYKDGTYRSVDGRLIQYVERGSRKRKPAYVLKVEELLGHELPAEAVIHHVDGDPSNDTNNNLIVCEDRAYHALLHSRQRIVDAGGDPNTQRICAACKQIKSISNFYIGRSGRRVGKIEGRCKACTSLYNTKSLEVKCYASQVL